MAGTETREEVQRTLVIVKPDGVQRGLVGEILGRFERRGLKLVGLKLINVGHSLAQTHYAEHRGKFFYEDLVQHLTSGPCVVGVLEGPQAIPVVRAMVGATRPHEAAPGTIRGDLALVGLRNLVHAADGPQSAAREIALFFQPDELLDYSRELDRWVR